MRDGHQRVVLLNLTNLSYADSSGLGALLGMFLEAKKNGATLRLHSPSQRLHDLLVMTRLRDVLENQRLQFAGPRGIRRQLTHLGGGFLPGGRFPARPGRVRTPPALARGFFAGLPPRSPGHGECTRIRHGTRKSAGTPRAQDVHGHVSRGFEAVREAFVENFEQSGELGGACCVYHRGEKVVDLWGGIRNKADRRAVGSRTRW